jgi:hypothetical protein
VNVIATAIGDVDGEIEFHCSAETQTSSILRNKADNGHASDANSASRTIVVPIQKVDSLFADVKLETPALLKRFRTGR